MSNECPEQHEISGGGIKAKTGNPWISAIIALSILIGSIAVLIYVIKL
jgi:hypothetical protein